MPRKLLGDLPALVLATTGLVACNSDDSMMPQGGGGSPQDGSVCNGIAVTATGDRLCLAQEPLFDPEQAPPPIQPPVTGSLPTSVDNAYIQQSCPTIHDQGSCGWCVAHAFTAGLEAEGCREGQAEVRLSEPHLWYLSHGKSDLGFHCGGMNVPDAFKVALDALLVSQVTWPYSPDMAAVKQAKPSDEILEQQGELTLTGYEAVKPGSVQSLKAALATGHPVVYVVPVFSTLGWSLACSNTRWAGGDIPRREPDEADPTCNMFLSSVCSSPDFHDDLAHCRCVTSLDCPNLMSCIDGRCADGYHAILITGYDDADGGFFSFKNSWGSTWGSSGYGRLSYDYISAMGLGGLFATGITRCSPSCELSYFPVDVCPATCPGEQASACTPTGDIKTCQRDECGCVHCVEKPCSSGICNGTPGFASCGVCGDGACDVGETCSSCPDDCGCSAGSYCTAGACLPCEENYCQTNQLGSGDHCDGSTVRACSTSTDGCFVELTSHDCSPAACQGGVCQGCGDGTCGTTESPCTCPLDCGACSGCCDAGWCEPGTEDDACGQSGSACLTCPPDEECIAQSCSPSCQANFAVMASSWQDYPSGCADWNLTLSSQITASSIHCRKISTTAQSSGMGASDINVSAGLHTYSANDSCCLSSGDLITAVLACECSGTGYLNGHPGELLVGAHDAGKVIFYQQETHQCP